MGRPRTNNVQINIAIPSEWKKELENLARIYSVEEGKTITFLDLMRRGIQEKYHSASHCKYLIQYHIIRCPKFIFPVLKGNVKDALKQILQKICNDYNYHIKSLEVMPDHIHIFIDVPQTVAPCDVVRTLKSISAIELFKVFPKLKQFYSKCGVLWSRGYFVSTVGHISEATVIKYIEEQKDDKSRRIQKGSKTIS